MKQDKLPKEQLTPKGASYSGSNGAAKELEELIYKGLVEREGYPSNAGEEASLREDATALLEHLIEQSNAEAYYRGMAQQHAKDLEEMDIEARIDELEMVINDPRKPYKHMRLKQLKALSTDTAGEDK